MFARAFARHNERARRVDDAIALLDEEKNVLSFLGSYAPARRQPFHVRPLDESSKAQTIRFIDGWDADDVYDRFGTAGGDNKVWLSAQLTELARPALIAVNASGVVGLLDYIYAEDAIHMGIVVDSRFRESWIGTNLVLSLLRSKPAERPLFAECRIDNRAAIGLLRGCHFQRISVDRHDMTWRHQ